MEMSTSIAEAKPNKLFYVVSNVVLVNTVDQTCLLLQRGEHEKEAAGKWGFPGGKGEHDMIMSGRVGDFFGIVALEECTQESGLTFDPAATQVVANGAFIRKDGIPVVWVTLAAPYEGGEVILEDGMSNYGWFTEESLPAAEECVGTVHNEAILALNALCPSENKT